VLRSLWRSIVPAPLVPRDDRDRLRLVRILFLLHLRPAQLPAATLRHRLTWGLGGSCLVLIGLLMATGTLMMLVYEPTPEHAYESVRSIEGQVLFGQLVRNLHYYSANLLVVLALLHLLRVYFTGAYLGPRQFNWVIGLALMVGVLAANFTGYLLPWDQLSYWAITISTGMLGYVPVLGEGLTTLARGGAEIGPATLITFYTLHTTIIPVTLIGLMGWHFWRVRKAGGVVMPRAPGKEHDQKPDKLPFVPNLLLRELTQAAVLVALVIVMAVVANAPLGAAANPGMSPNPAKAPWYFAGFQELLLHLPPVLAVVVIPALSLLLLAAIPYLRYQSDPSGVWFQSHRGRRTALLAAVVAAIVTPLWVVADELWGNLGGVLPVLVLALVIGFAVAVRRVSAAAKDEVIQSLLVLLLTGLVVLTVTCVWFRGPGMELIWPWRLL
jgi:quinol-cytochrome oxidoreductase complex cytochrome b subunit